MLLQSALGGPSSGPVPSLTGHRSSRTEGHHLGTAWSCRTPRSVWEAHFPRPLSLQSSSRVCGEGWVETEACPSSFPPLECLACPVVTSCPALPNTFPVFTQCPSPGRPPVWPREELSNYSVHSRPQRPEGAPPPTGGPGNREPPKASSWTTSCLSSSSPMWTGISQAGWGASAGGTCRGHV